MNKEYIDQFYKKHNHNEPEFVVDRELEYKNYGGFGYI